jgi:hypothetical protein
VLSRFLRDRDRGAKQVSDQRPQSGAEPQSQQIGQVLNLNFLALSSHRLRVVGL